MNKSKPLIKKSLKEKGVQEEPKKLEITTKIIKNYRDRFVPADLPSNQEIIAGLLNFSDDDQKEKE